MKSRVSFTTDVDTGSSSSASGAAVAPPAPSCAPTVGSGSHPPPSRYPQPRPSSASSAGYVDLRYPYEDGNPIKCAHRPLSLFDGECTEANGFPYWKDLYVRQLIGEPMTCQLPWYDKPPPKGKVLFSSAPRDTVYGPVREVAHFKEELYPDGCLKIQGFVSVRVPNPYYHRMHKWNTGHTPEEVWINIWTSHLSLIHI